MRKTCVRELVNEVIQLSRCYDIQWQLTNKAERARSRHGRLITQDNGYFFPVLILGLFFLSQSAPAQGGIAAGRYQITSGTYVEIGGLGGSRVVPLPNAKQKYVEMTFNPQSNLAQMKLLANDHHTVFCTLSNGIVLPDHIRFEEPVPPPPPGLPYLCYTASNSAGALRIDGVRITPLPGPDLPNQLFHTNVLALLMPVATLQIAESGHTQLCWNTMSNCCYVIESRSDLDSTNDWTSTRFVRGDGTDCCIDLGDPTYAQQFYRIRAFLYP